MASTIFEDLQQTLEQAGDKAALAKLCDHLQEKKDYDALFYAKLMQKRQELGLSPVPSGPALEVPEEHHTTYEDAIRDAGQLVGGLNLEQGNLEQAWVYFRMLGEPEPVRAALDKLVPGEEDELHNLVQIAFYENVHPRKGFDWILDQFGLCNAITTLSSVDLPQEMPDRQYCLQRLVRALYSELRERLLADIERVEEKAPPEADSAEDASGVVVALLKGRDNLFDEEMYHIDVSHLSSVVQMSMSLEPCPELGLARELCAYGKKLSSSFTNPGDPPFENLYEAADHYLAILSGEAVEEGLQYFRDQAENADPETIGTYPAEVLVNLLLQANRKEEALEVACKYLNQDYQRRLSCPNLIELCQQTKAFDKLAEISRDQDDPVHYLAGLLGERK